VAPAIEFLAGGQAVRLSNPDKSLIPGVTKRDLAEHYLAMGDAALRAVRDRPMIMFRFPDGITGEPFHQKRVAANRPDWLKTAVVNFPGGRSAEQVCAADLAHIVWMVNLGCIDMHPWPVRSDDVEHPDELRIDLDPQPGVPFAQVREVALVVQDVLREGGVVGFPKTSGSRGLHVYVRLSRVYSFEQVRAAAVAVARAVERRAPTIATAAWWKEERGDRVFLDYNQNLRDRSTAAAYSVRPRPEALVSAPLSWDEVRAVDPNDFTIASMPARLAAIGDPMAAMDDAAYRLETLLAWAARDEADGLPDAPYPPHYPKGAKEAPRVAPSRAKKPKPD
jgi:bifunctional non-homologous end joining protein LigD